MQGVSILQSTNLGSLQRQMLNQLTLQLKQLAKPESEITPAKTESPHSFHFTYLNGQDFKNILFRLLKCLFHLIISIMRLKSYDLS